MKYSKQREMILKTLREHAVHPTADYIYGLLREEMPNISLARFIETLTSWPNAGKLAKLPDSTVRCILIIIPTNTFILFAINVIRFTIYLLRLLLLWNKKSES